MDNRQVDFSADEVLRDPYPSYDTLRDTAPVLWDDVQQAWLVVGYPEARRLALDPRLSAGADMTPFVEGLQERHSDVAKKLKEHFESWMLFSDDPRHADLRSLIAPAMSTAVVSPYRQPLRDRARQLLASTGPDLDVVDDYAVPLSRLSLAQVQIGRASCRERV